MDGPTLVWRVGERSFDCAARTHVMGILNVTPDSFSDGGRFFATDAAVEHGVRMAAEGADIIDVGGESTRPGSDPVSAGEERARVVPVVRRLRTEVDVPVSIDTRKREVAEAALEAGATIVNDVSAGADPDMFRLARDASAGIVLMHMRGEPKTMQQNTHYVDVVGEVRAFLEDRLRAAVESGIDLDRVVVDPGLGFAKTSEQSLLLMARIDALLGLDRPILVGPSRKSFIGAVLGTDVDERVEGTLAAAALMISRGAHIIRVHEVKEMVRASKVIDAIRETAPALAV